MSSQPPPPGLRIGLVGSGPWAELAVAPGLVAAPAVTLTHGWSRNHAALTELADRHGFVSVPTFADLIESVDAVAFCVPPDVQAHLAPEALDAGLPLLLEKPVARTVEQAARLDDHVAPVLVHYTRLLDGHVRPWLDAAAQREWSRARVVLTNSATLGNDPFGRSPWRRDDEGALWDLGPHALSALQVVLGAVTEVTARRRGADIVLATVHVGGATAQIVVSLASVTPVETVELFDEAGAVHRLEATKRQDGATTYAAMVAMLAAPGGARHGPCDAAVRSPRFSTSIVAVLAAASRSLREGSAVATDRRPPLT